MKDDLAKFKGSTPMGGIPLPQDPPVTSAAAPEERKRVASEVYLRNLLNALEGMLVQGSYGDLHKLREHATGLERTLRESINTLVKTANDMDLKEDHKEAISYHLFRKLDELASAIDTVNEKIDAIQLVSLEAVIKRLCNED